MKVIKRRLKKKPVIILIVFLILSTILCFNIVKIIKIFNEYNKSNYEAIKLQKVTEIEIIEDTETTEVIEQKEEILKTSPYWDYIKMKLINVDFKNLKNTNKETTGWIQVNGTNINYPITQAKDNDYYLNHSFDKSYNSAGWIFMDYRNSKDFSDRNTIIYGHALKNGTMFGSLKKILSTDWVNNTDNYIVKISTESNNTLWQVFSIYTIPKTSDYLKTNFVNNEDFLTFGNMLLNRSEFNFNTTLNENDKIVTLSTCYNKVNRVVLHAKLIKIEQKQI